MKPISRLLATTATLSVLSALPALADVTAQQVWDNWQSVARTLGQTMTAGSETVTGGTLTLTDIAVHMTTADGTVDGTIAEMTLAEKGDGTVEILMSPDYALKVAMQPELGEAVDIDMVLSMPGMVTVASGDPQNLRYDFDAPSLTMTIAEMIVEGAPSGMELTGEITALSGNYSTTGTGDDMTFDSAMTAGTMGFDLSGRDPETPGVGFTMSALYKDLTASSGGNAAGMAAMTDPAMLGAENASFTSSYTHGGGTFGVTGTEEDGASFNWKSTTASGTLGASVNGGLFDYSGTATGVAMALSGTAIPFPELTAAMDEFTFALAGPLTRTDTPEDFSLLLNMAGLTVSDVLWSMIDPGQGLPRDPATLTIDLAGKGRMTMDISDPAAMESATPPGELHALDLNRLRLAIAGAELTGSGQFSFDNGDMVTFGGFPAPDGKIDLKLVGGNALLDKLVAMGLIPEDQAMGARMMMGLFAVPSGEDTLDSTIEISPDGGISANGQRLQ